MIILSDKEKILHYLDFKGINKSRFYSKTGLSNGFLDQGSSLGVDKLRKILDIYLDLNPEWFFNDHFDMILNEYTQSTPDMIEEPRPPYNASQENYLLSIISEKDDKIQICYEEIGRLKEIVRRFQSSDRSVKDLSDKG